MSTLQKAQHFCRLFQEKFWLKEIFFGVKLFKNTKNTKLFTIDKMEINK